MLTRLPILTASFFALSLMGLTTLSNAETVIEEQLTPNLIPTQELHIALAETDKIASNSSDKSLVIHDEIDPALNEAQEAVEVEDLLPGCD